MIFRTVNEMIGTDREYVGDGFKSRRLVTQDDGLPVSVHETTIAADLELRFCYREHSETVYCIQGSAKLENIASGEVHTISPGTLYSLGIGEEHVLRTVSLTRFLCIFDPPLAGDELAESRAADES